MQSDFGWPAEIFSKDIAEIRETIKAARESYPCADKFILAAFPKSGSTYTCNVLAEAIGYEVHQKICNQMPFSPKDITLSGIYGMRSHKTISQLHIFATGANLEFISAFNMKVLVLVRHVSDVLISLCDHMKNIDYFANIIPRHVMDDMNQEQKLDYIVDVAVPWLFTFYYSWVLAEKNHSVAVTWLRYEDLVGDPSAYFSKAVQAMLGSPEDAAIQQALSAIPKDEETRFNVGRAGRGELELSAAHKKKIKDHALHYKGIDLSPLGV